MATLAAEHDLGLEISEHKDFGEGTMTVFIQKHLASILRPFGEHVEHLHQAVAQLTTESAEAQLVAGDHTTELSQHAGLLAGLRREADGVAQALAAAQSQLGAIHADQLATRQDIGKAIAHTKEVDGQHRQTLEALLELQQEVKGTNFTVARLRSEVGGIERAALSKVHVACGELHSRHDALNQAHSATAERSHAAARLGEDTSEAVRKLTQSSGRRAREDGARMQQVEGAVARLEALLVNTDDRIQSQATALASHRASSAPVQLRVDQALKAQVVLENWQKDTRQQMRTTDQRLTDINQLLTDLNLRQPATDKMGVDKMVDVVEELLAHSGEHALELKALEKRVESQSEQVEGQGRQLKAECGELRETLQKDKTQVQALEQTLQLITETAEREKREDALAAGQQSKSTAGRLDWMASELTSVGTALQRTGADLGATHRRVQKVEDDMAAADERAARLGNTMELTQEYWKGLTKGFRETHRSVNVNNDLLPPRGALSTTGGVSTQLPALLPTSPAKKAAGLGTSAGGLSARC